MAVQGDVGVEADVVRLFATCDAELGRVAALVNNAGILETQMRVEAMDAGRLQRVLTANVISAVPVRARGGAPDVDADTAVRAAPSSTSRRAPRGSARPASTSTTPPRRARSTASPSAWPRRLPQEGIRVNAVRPGVIYTDIHASGGEPDRVDRVKASVPMRRGGTADEVAHAILWLLSDEASYTTGAFIDVTGGR